jgi:FtsP/CotA-like multicopper oxidase with cupredoxin domain
MATLRVIRRQPHRITLLMGAGLVAAFALLVGTQSNSNATSGGNPYATPNVVDTNPAPDVVETTIVADETTVDLGNGVTAHAQTFNGAIPGPTFHLNVGDTVIVHFENHLEPDTVAPIDPKIGVTGIHWHGIELENSADGTPFTQNQVPPGGSFLYKFKVSRPGIYWYHPHHHSSTNQVFKGLYGMIVVTDPNEAALIGSGTLPPAAQTKQIVLSDTTVCKTPGSNDTDTYDVTPPTAPWIGGGDLPAQSPATPPVDLCETGPLDEEGATAPVFGNHDIPNIQRTGASRTNEGQTVLTNGKNVGGRAGDQSAPGALDGGASTLDVLAGQGLRLQFVNAATIRYFRLRLTTSTGTLVPLVRVGGEGGLLDSAVVEGGTVGAFDTKYTTGEIVLPPGSRADVVAAIPASATGVLTMWTEDYTRTGQTWSNLPTVPVMHLNVTGSAPSTYTIAAGTALRSATGDPQIVLGAATGTLLDPASFSPSKPGLSAQDIKLIATGGGVNVDSVTGTHDLPGDYTTFAHLGSTRYAKLGDTLQLSVTNQSQAHHPFHLHGFSMQPISLTDTQAPIDKPPYTWPYTEYRDNIDVPGGYTLTFRIKLDDRPLADGVTLGGGLGRWVFHCHIFFHATLGMLSEVVVTSPTGKEKPFVNANTTLVDVANEGDIATAHGTFADNDGEAVTLSASIGSVTDDGGGTWTWTYDTDGATVADQFVYITATDAGGRKDQAPFALHINNINAPPVVTVDDAAGNEGSATAVHATAVDGEGDPLTNTWTYAPAGGVDAGTTCAFGNIHALSTTFTCTDDGTFTITLTSDDGQNEPAHDDGTVTVSNVAPHVSITSPLSGQLFQLADTIPLVAPFTDAGTHDTHTCSIAWGDGATTAGLVVELAGAGTCTGSHHYATGGHKTIAATVTDDDTGHDAASVTIDINTPPDCNPVQPSPNSLWPPNKAFRRVTLSGATDADGDTVTLTVTAVRQDEPRPGAPTAKLVAGHSDQVDLSADRDGKGDGRVYRITFGGDDGRGGTCTATKKVSVLHDQGDTTAVDSPLSVNSL